MEADLDSVRAKISRLGAINLAAPDEIDAETKRKEELDLQYNDLTDALEKLNQAISKIDKETKEKFIQSFNAVNTRLQEMFPILFGGGRAELFLTESNYLHAGVKLMKPTSWQEEFFNFSIIWWRKSHDCTCISFCFI